MSVSSKADNSLVPVPDQMFNGHACSGLVLNANGVCLCYFNRPIDSDHWNTSRCNLLQILILRVYRNQQDAINRLMRHHFHLCCFDCNVFIRSSQPDEVTALPGCFLYSMYYNREESVRNIRNNKSDRSG